MNISYKPISSVYFGVVRLFYCILSTSVIVCFSKSSVIETCLLFYGVKGIQDHKGVENFLEKIPQVILIKLYLDVFSLLLEIDLSPKWRPKIQIS